VSSGARDDVEPGGLDDWLGSLRGQRPSGDLDAPRHDRGAPRPTGPELPPAARPERPPVVARRPSPGRAAPGRPRSTASPAAHRFTVVPDAVVDGFDGHRTSDAEVWPRERFRHRLRLRRQQMPWWQELILLVLIAICLAAVLRTFLLESFLIPSASMDNTLHVGDRVAVNKVVYDFTDPSRGSVVVFRGPRNWVPETPNDHPGVAATVGRGLGSLVGVTAPGQKDFIKRVIGLPGDTVSCCDTFGRVLVNGYPLDEGYIFQNSPRGSPTIGGCQVRDFNQITVPPGDVFVMGDHRLVSEDSRCKGPIPIGNIFGHAFAVAWPPSHWRTLGMPTTFAHVPAAFALDAPVVRPAGSADTDRGPAGPPAVDGLAPDPVEATGRRLAG
jgi:signal peptidase I